MQTANIETARFNMVEQQIRPCEIIDERVLHVLRDIPREHFVPKAYKGLAFSDIHVPLNNNTHMMKPMQEGIMLQALDVQTGDRVLEVGTGSGFITACLLALGGQVTSYEIDAGLSAQAAKRLAGLNMHGAKLVVGDIFAAQLAEQSFDVIAVTASSPVHVEALEALLAPGGRLFVIQGEDPVMCANLVTRTEDGAIHRDALCETRLEALDNAPQPERFVF
jgi:protein-L-isoaspartate(D-aspartate) O-methyltransferase